MILVETRIRPGCALLAASLTCGKYPSVNEGVDVDGSLRPIQHQSRCRRWLMRRRDSVEPGCGSRSVDDRRLRVHAGRCGRSRRAGRCRRCGCRRRGGCGRRGGVRAGGCSTRRNVRCASGCRCPSARWRSGSGRCSGSGGCSSACWRSRSGRRPSTGCSCRCSTDCARRGRGGCSGSGCCAHGRRWRQGCAHWCGAGRRPRGRSAYPAWSCGVRVTTSRPRGRTRGRFFALTPAGGSGMNLESPARQQRSAAHVT